MHGLFCVRAAAAGAAGAGISVSGSAAAALAASIDLTAVADAAQGLILGAFMQEAGKKGSSQIVHKGDSGSDSKTTNTLSDAQKSRLKSLKNTINDHLTEEDFSGTLRDLQGDPVPDGRGGYFDHLGEMKNSYASLKKIKKALEGSLKNPNLSDIDRALLQEGLNTADSYISRIQELFKPYGGIE